MKILIAGGTGFLGESIINHWPEQAEFTVLSTNIDLVNNESIHYWDGQNLGPWIHLLKETDVLINLAGKSVNCRYNKGNKAKILRSRIDSTRTLGQAICQCDAPPPLWINASTATIYRDEWIRPNTEAEGVLGNGFSVKVAKEWEQTFYQYHHKKTRQVALRTSLVLGKNGDLFNILQKHVNMGLSGRHGSGNQMMSWIHEVDFVRAIYHIIEHQSIEGSVNITSPNPVSDKDFLAAFCGVLNKPQGLIMPIWMLNIGAMICKSETELLLKSRWVIPQVLLENGFEFIHSNIESALTDLHLSGKSDKSMSYCPMHC